MKRLWIVGALALAAAIAIAVVVQDPAEAVADPVQQEAPPPTPSIEDVLPADHVAMEAAALQSKQDLYEDLTVTREEFSAQVGALSAAMAATAEENAQTTLPNEDKALPAWAAGPNAN